MSALKRQLLSRIEFLTSDKLREKIDNWIISLAIAGFLIHLGLIFAANLGWIEGKFISNQFFADPISAIYTPFSFILIYEVYLLVYFLSRSITDYIGKQYEVISLIVIRRIFKDISKLELEGDWLSVPYNQQFIGDCLGILAIFALIFVFKNLYKARSSELEGTKLENFILSKRLTSNLLIIVLIGLAIFSVVGWIREVFLYHHGLIDALSDVNGIFYHEFFTILILVDVLLLLISFRYTENYNALIRNSGFVISTIMIKVSFNTTGIVNVILICSAIAFGVIILWIYNQYEKRNYV
ncbi:MAG: hypothetical protein AAF927_08085 [Bacteroidota bacterium]